MDNFLLPQNCLVPYSSTYMYHLILQVILYYFIILIRRKIKTTQKERPDVCGARGYFSDFYFYMENDLFDLSLTTRRWT